jgi:hypothetical protein
MGTFPLTTLPDDATLSIIPAVDGRWQLHSPREAAPWHQARPTHLPPHIELHPDTLIM